MFHAARRRNERKICGVFALWLCDPAAFASGVSGFARPREWGEAGVRATVRRPSAGFDGDDLAATAAAEGLELRIGADARRLAYELKRGAVAAADGG
jgi:hypothetical protein